MAIYFKSKDKKIRALVAKMELARARIRFFTRNASLSIAEKQEIQHFCGTVLRKLLPLSMRSRNRCVVTGRAGSVFRDFRVSRITLKGLASKGLLTGISKSSW